MAADPTESKDLLAWYAGLRPLTVDIIGDFAGRDLYVVHGESLIRHCLEQSRVDFNGITKPTTSPSRQSHTDISL